MVTWVNEVRILPTKTLDRSNTALDPSLNVVYLQEVSGVEPNTKPRSYMVNCRDNQLTRQVRLI
jgi:hypothetical protein